VEDVSEEAIMQELGGFCKNMEKCRDEAAQQGAGGWNRQVSTQTPRRKTHWLFLCKTYSYTPNPVGEPVMCDSELRDIVLARHIFKPEDLGGIVYVHEGKVKQNKPIEVDIEREIQHNGETGSWLTIMRPFQEFDCIRWDSNNEAYFVPKKN
jgi:hypothetical protein